MDKQAMIDEIATGIGSTIPNPLLADDWRNIQQRVAYRDGFKERVATIARLFVYGQESHTNALTDAVIAVRDYMLPALDEALSQGLNEPQPKPVEAVRAEVLAAIERMVSAHSVESGSVMPSEQMTVHVALDDVAKELLDTLNRLTSELGDLRARVRCLERLPGVQEALEAAYQEALKHPDVAQCLPDEGVVR